MVIVVHYAFEFFCALTLFSQPSATLLQRHQKLPDTLLCGVVEMPVARHDLGYDQADLPRILRNQMTFFFQRFLLRY